MAATPIITGIAVVWGSSGSLSFGSITDALWSNYGTTDNADNTYTLDSNGVVVGLVSKNPMKTLTVEYVPAGASIATARSHVDTPGMLSTVTIASSVDMITGSWAYLGGGAVRADQNNHVVMTLPLTRFGTSANTATVLTAMS